MITSSLIHIDHICTNCAVDLAFIQSLHELGHVELVIEQNEQYIMEDQLKSVESLIYFHQELHINLEGIDAIAHLLKKNQALQQEVNTLQNKLQFFMND